MMRLCGSNIIVAIFALCISWHIAIESCIIAEYDKWSIERLQAIGKNSSSPCDQLSAGPAPTAKNANIFLFHKDEHEVLPDWLQYHTHLVGFHNVHIVDGDSTNPQVCKLLALYSLCGVDVSRFNESFTEKHTAMSNKMRMHNNSFLIPLDTDEFITFPVGGNRSDAHAASQLHFSTNRDTILSQLNKIPIDGFKYKFNGYQVQYNTSDCEASTKLESYDPNVRRLTHPAFVGPSQYGPFMSKTFYYSKGFISTNQGNHNGLVEHDHGVPKTAVFDHNFHHTGLCMLHFYTSSYHSMRQKFLRGAAAYGFNEKSACGANMYCALAKHYRSYNKDSHDHYVQACQHSKKHMQHISMDDFTDWFVHNAKPFAELIGEPLVTHDLYE